MNDFVSFASSTRRNGLPLLVAGQAQKEFLVNEAFARLDILLHPVVEGELAAPPPAPKAGDCFIVAVGASGPWEGRDGAVCGWDGSLWTYCQPYEGMSVLDRATLRRKYFRNGWELAPEPTAPASGDVVDVEARAAIDTILEVLKLSREIGS